VCSATVLPFWASWLLTLAPTGSLALAGLVLSLTVMARFTWKSRKDPAQAVAENRDQFKALAFGVVESLLLLLALIFLAFDIAASCAPAPLVWARPFWLGLAFLVIGTITFALSAIAGVSFASSFACCSNTRAGFEYEHKHAPACFGKPPPDVSGLEIVHMVAIVVLGVLASIAFALVYVGTPVSRTWAAALAIAGFGVYALATLAVLVRGTSAICGADKYPGGGSDMIAFFASLLIAVGAIVSIAIALAGSAAVVYVVLWLVLALALASCAFCCVCWSDVERLENEA